MLISSRQYMSYAQYNPPTLQNNGVNQQRESSGKDNTMSYSAQMAQNANEMFDNQTGNFAIGLNPFVGNNPNINRQEGFADYNLIGSFCKHTMSFFGSFQNVLNNGKRIQHNHQIQQEKQTGLNYMA